MASVGMVLMIPSKEIAQSLKTWVGYLLPTRARDAACCPDVALPRLLRRFNGATDVTVDI